MVVTGRKADRLPDGHGVSRLRSRCGTVASPGTAAALSGAGPLVPGDLLVSRRPRARGAGRPARELQWRRHRPVFVRHPPLRAVDRPRGEADLASRRPSPSVLAGPGAPLGARLAHEAGACRLRRAPRLPDRRLHRVQRRHLDLRDQEQRRRGRLAGEAGRAHRKVRRTWGQVSTCHIGSPDNSFKRAE